MEVEKIFIGCDHAGFPYKAVFVERLKAKGIEVYDKGTDSKESVDYPDFVHPVAQKVAAGAGRGVLMCGSGNGVAMTANKYQGVRAALCWNVELAQLARQHNDANILAVPVRFVDEQTALDMLDAFLEASFEGGRHQRRVEKISPAQ